MKADITKLTSLLCDLIALEYINKVASCRFYVSLERSSLIWAESLKKEDHISGVLFERLKDECTLLHYYYLTITQCSDFTAGRDSKRARKSRIPYIALVGNGMDNCTVRVFP